jgi:hypothetical protein
MFAVSYYVQRRPVSVVIPSNSKPSKTTGSSLSISSLILRVKLSPGKSPKSMSNSLARMRPDRKNSFHSSLHRGSPQSLSSTIGTKCTRGMIQELLGFLCKPRLVRVSQTRALSLSIAPLGVLRQDSVAQTLPKCEGQGQAGRGRLQYRRFRV